jgi:hypothetical protein
MQKRQPGRTKRRSKLPASGLKRRRSEARKTFARVFRLLEQYGPRLYSLDLRRDLRTALETLRKQ